MGHLRADALDNDLTLVYIGVRIGLEHGWTHIYSLPLQHALFIQLRPHATFNNVERFISPPPLAWLVLPLSPLGPAGATYAWLVISLIALVAAWWMAAPGSMPQRALWLLGAAAWYPVLYGLSLAQPALLVVLLGAAAWWLAERDRPMLAGAVLGLSVIKPQLTLLLPVALLFAGRWRIVAGWAVAASLLAAASLLVVGAQGLHDYLALLDEAEHVTYNRYFTTAYVLGEGPGSYIVQALVAVALTVAAYANRHAGSARIFALGLVATALGATYWHLQDYTVLVLAAWLFWRERPPAWQALILLAVAITAELAWPLTPLPLLLGLTAWFACLAIPPSRATIPTRA